MSDPYMQAMIFAAGLGSRLKPLTDSTPKALINVGGEPLLKRVILKLKKEGFTHVVINVHHYADQIIDYIKANNSFGLSINISDEREKLLDTGGGLKKAAALFDQIHPILIHNVDILSDVDLKRLYFEAPLVKCNSCGVYHLRADATLLVSQRKTNRYLIFDDDMRLVGWINIQTNEIKSPYQYIREMNSQIYHKMCEKINTDKVELTPNASQEQNYYRHLNSSKNPLKPDADELRINHLHLYAFSGIHVFSPNFFKAMDVMPDTFNIIDFYLQNCDRYYIKGYPQKDLHLIDVGKLETIKDAEKFLQTVKTI